MKLLPPFMLFLTILVLHNPVKAQQSISLFIDTPCQISNQTEPIKLPDIDLFEIFPNPNQGDFTVKFIDTQLNERAEISIYDSRGKLIWLNCLEVTESQHPVHLSGISSGLYVVSINCGQLISREKLIIY